MGLISSSDHKSTGHSYACVWSADPSREGIFKAMRDRRTFGATDKIRLVFTAGDNWMGEIVETASTPEFRFEIKGTGIIKEINFYIGDKAVKSFKCDTLARLISMTLNIDFYYAL